MLSEKSYGLLSAGISSRKHRFVLRLRVLPLVSISSEVEMASTSKDAGSPAKKKKGAFSRGFPFYWRLSAVLWDRWVIAHVIPD